MNVYDPFPTTTGDMFPPPLSAEAMYLAEGDRHALLTIVAPEYVADMSRARALDTSVLDKEELYDLEGYLLDPSVEWRQRLDVRKRWHVRLGLNDPDTNNMMFFFDPASQQTHDVEDSVLPGALMLRDFRQHNPDEWQLCAEQVARYRQASAAALAEVWAGATVDRSFRQHDTVETPTIVRTVEYWIMERRMQSVLDKIWGENTTPSSTAEQRQTIYDNLRALCMDETAVRRKYESE